MPSGTGGPAPRRDGEPDLEYVRELLASTGMLLQEVAEAIEAAKALQAEARRLREECPGRESAGD
jgi:hypothetical protein